MGEEIAFENGRISNFEGLMTLDRVLLHTVVHHSSTSTYMTNSLKSKKLLRLALLGRLCRRVYLTMENRHPVQGLFGCEFPTICVVMAA